MKRLLLILFSIILCFNVMGQTNSLILNVEPLPDNVLTTETPLVLSLQLINENDMEAYIDRVFFEEDKAKIEAMHQSGDISDSLYQIYKAEWDETDLSESNSIVNPSNITWEQENEDGTWSSIRVTMHELNLLANEEAQFTSDLIFYGIDPDDVNALMRVKKLRAISNGVNSNPINLNLSNFQNTAQTSTESGLYYISNYWTLRQDHNQALQFANRIVSNYPNAFSGYFQRGVSQYHLGLKNEALATFEQAFELVTEEQFGIEPPDRLLDYYYRVQSELLQPQKN